MAKDVPSTLQEGRLKVASTAFFCLLMCECRIPWATGPVHAHSAGPIPMVSEHTSRACAPLIQGLSQEARRHGHPLNNHEAHLIGQVACTCDVCHMWWR